MTVSAPGWALVDKTAEANLGRIVARALHPCHFSIIIYHPGTDSAQASVSAIGDLELKDARIFIDSLAECEIREDLGEFKADH